VAAERIYREDPPRVTTSRNQIGLFLSKRIRHGFVEKINGKRRPQTCEALGWISTDYSRARRALASITPSYTCKCIESNSPYK
jgi:hypothetical protein